MRRTVSRGLFAIAAAAPLAIVLAGGGGCSLTTDLGALTAGPALSTTGGEGGEGGANPGAPTDGGTGADASTSSGDAQPQACTPGGKIGPIGVTAFPDTLSAGSTCNLEAALVVDGTFAGLDRPHSASQSNVDGLTISSCMLLDFGAEQAPLSVTIKIRAAGNACASSPCVPGDAGCGTGQSVTVITAPSSKKWKAIDSFSINDTAGDLVVPLDGLFVRYVLACRGASGQDRDDVEIDGVTLGCR